MAETFPFLNYRVLFTPLISDDEYGDVEDVTENIDKTDFIKSIGTIQREIDNGDYDIGIFTFGDITLSCINFSRKFNGPEDPRSMFKFRRDRCKVEIIFFDEDGDDTTRFKGLINDDATRLDFGTGIIRFKVLSYDSILRQLPVQAGSIVDGDLISLAIKKILNVPKITTLLTYSPSNVNVDLDLAIDVGEVFSNIPSKEAIDDLLLASNSILFIDNTDTIYVKSRIGTVNTFYLYGRGDRYGRENILRIKDYNNGIQRALSSVKVGELQVATAEDWVLEYGFRQKSMSFDFITTESKELQIAEKILAAFKVPKPELQLTVKTKAVAGIQLLDHVSVDYDFRYAPSPPDLRLPFWGTAVWGAFRWPFSQGNFKIEPNVKWKVIGVEDDPVKFTTTLKLRQSGTTVSDGYFT